MRAGNCLLRCSRGHEGAPSQSFWFKAAQTAGPAWPARQPARQPARLPPARLTPCLLACPQQAQRSAIKVPGHGVASKHHPLPSKQRPGLFSRKAPGAAGQRRRPKLPVALQHVGACGALAVGAGGVAGPASAPPAAAFISPLAGGQVSAAAAPEVFLSGRTKAAVPPASKAACQQ